MCTAFSAVFLEILFSGGATGVGSWFWHDKCAPTLGPVVHVISLPSQPLRLCVASVTKHQAAIFADISSVHERLVYAVALDSKCPKVSWCGAQF